MANRQPAQHSSQSIVAVHGQKHSPDRYESTISMDHPTLRPKTNYKERSKGSSDVPIPAALKLP